MVFLDLLNNEFNSLENYCNIDKYKLSPRAFSMNGVWSFFDYVLFILSNKGKSLTLEIEEFVEKCFDDEEDKLITKEAISKQRQKFSYKIFEDMNDSFVKKFYESDEYEPLYKDKIVLIADGSKSEIPNTPESKEWANIKDKEGESKKSLRVLFSTLTDAKYDIVLDSELAQFDSSERVLLHKHLEKINEFLDLKNVILMLDAGYYSLELKLFLDNLSINYIFRVPKCTYKREISQMTSFDEELKIKNLSGRRKQISDPELLKQAQQLPYFETRVIKTPIINQEGKEDELILLTNLSKKEHDGDDLLNLYKQRWEIEVNYDRLKNKMEIENYSGKLEETIKQDFHSSMYIFNLAMILKINIHEKLERKNKKKRKKENKEYRTNINILIGRIKNKLIKLFTSKKTKINNILKLIIKRGTKTTYLHDFKRLKIQWHKKRFIGKYRFNQRKNS